MTRGLYSAKCKLSRTDVGLQDSVFGLSDDNMGAGCANFCFCPGGRIACFAEDRVYLIENWGIEGDGLGIA